MKISVNSIIQTIGTIGQILNGAGSVFPPGSKGQGVTAGIVAIAQGITAIFSHFSNPDGTSAKVAWTPATK